MKAKKVMALAMGVAFLFTTAGSASALIFQEEFLGSAGDLDYFAMAEPDFLPYPGIGNRAKFFFDLDSVVDTFNEARLIDTTGLSNVRIATEAPTIDETTYDSSLVLQWATIDFWISDFSVEAGDREKYIIDIEARDIFRTSDAFRLENVTDTDGLYKISIDLAVEGLLDYLADGDLLAIAIAPNLTNWTNTFAIDRVLLTAEATPAPVPEPATIVLLGSGLIGLAYSRRRAKRA